MAKREYVIIDYDMDEINEMGSKGWELVQIVDSKFSPGPRFALLKRKKKRFTFFK